jgi:ubiquinone/menaquinone biosynthesis C-methylase UbiE
MSNRLIGRLAGLPHVFDALRWILEGAYRGHEAVIVQELKGPHARILDFGCGTGIYARFFDPRAYIGIDLNRTYVAAAARKFPHHRFLVMNGLQLAFADASFDTCFISGVLHHLDDEGARQVLREIARVLKPEGALIVWEDTPTQFAWNGIGRLIHHWDLGQHIRSSREYQHLLETRFAIENAYPMRSGFMDYGVFRCTRKREPAKESA